MKNLLLISICSLSIITSLFIVWLLKRDNSFVIVDFELREKELIVFNSSGEGQIIESINENEKVKAISIINDNKVNYLKCKDYSCDAYSYDDGVTTKLFDVAETEESQFRNAYTWDDKGEMLFILNRRALIEQDNIETKTIFSWNSEMISLAGGPFCDNVLFIDRSVFFCRSVLFGGDKSSIAGRLYVYNTEQDLVSEINLQGYNATSIFKSSKR